ncbi:MAG: NAD/NADP octopine/nopaline dehydrogenase family protein [Candidatus Hodarchaeota archaeon]
MSAQVAILGAGHGGQGLAAYLTLKGNDVHLYNRSSARIKPIIRQGGIQVDGVIEGFAPLASCSTNIQQVMDDVEFVFFVVPASGHRDLAMLCAKHLSADQVLVLIPGRTGGALEVANTIESIIGWQPTISEAQTFPLVSRVETSGHAQVTAIKNELPIATFPAKYHENNCKLISFILPSVTSAEDVFDTGLANIGCVFHPAPLLLNLGRAESTLGQYNHYLEGVTPTVAQYIEQIDRERLAVGEALGKQLPSADEWLRLVYDSVGENLYECLQSTYCYEDLSAPSSLNHRYVFEDVPTGLVPIAAIGEQIGVPTPTIRTTINLASHLTGVDFWNQGRNADSLGITGLSALELLFYAQEGSLDIFSSHIVEENYLDEFDGVEPE